MGVVVAARDQLVPRTVAIKLMLKQAWGFGNAVERFLREARAASKMTSPNVVQVLDVGRTKGGTPYMVMEYLEGMSLDRLHRQVGVFAVEDAIDFTLQACAAVAEAHDLGIVHRDLKPGNLFMTQHEDGNPLVKLLDFGLSKLQEPDENDDLSLTDTTGTMGSPLYMSPEQCRSAKYVDPRSDIWSIGVTLFQFMSGRLPFEGESKAELFAMILAKEPQSLSEHAPWVARALEAVIMRCLLKDPNQRYQSVAELATALSAFASERGRIFCQSARLPVPFPLAPTRTSRRAVTSDSIVVAAPEPLDLGQFFSSLPTRSYDLRALESDDVGATSAVPVLSNSIPAPRRRRRGWLAFAAIGALALAAAAWFGLRDQDLAESAADTGARETSAPPTQVSGAGASAPVASERGDVVAPNAPPPNSAKEPDTDLEFTVAEADGAEVDGAEPAQRPSDSDGTDESPTTDTQSTDKAEEDAKSAAKKKKRRSSKKKKRRSSKKKRSSKKNSDNPKGPDDPFRTME